MSRPIIGYIVEAATKLFKSRKIGGVDFDGSSDIDLPGVNKPGNQDTTGNAASADKLSQGSSISIKGDAVATGVLFNGTENIELNLVFADVVAGEQIGGKNTIPVINVNAKGLVVGISGAEIGATEFTLVDETLTIAAKGSKSYNLETLAGLDALRFDYSKAKIIVRIKDTNSTSPTYNYYINSEAFLTVGVSLDGKNLLIANSRESSVETKVLVLVPNK